MRVTGPAWRVIDDGADNAMFGYADGRMPAITGNVGVVENVMLVRRSDIAPILLRIRVRVRERKSPAG